MKRLKRGLGLLISCMLIFTMTVWPVQAAVYDSTWTSGEPAVETEDPAQQTLLYPGDSIANTQVFLGENAVEPDYLENGETRWTNRSGKVYRVFAQGPQMVPVIDEETQQPLLDESQTPVMVESAPASYTLETVGGVIGVVDGTLETDAPFSEDGYSLPSEAVYPLLGVDGNPVLDENSNPIQVRSDSIATAAYPASSVTIKATDRTLEGKQFQKWSVYKMEDDRLTLVSEEGLASLAPGLSLATDPQDPVGTIMYNMTGSELPIVLVPVYAAPVTEEVPEVSETPLVDRSTLLPYGDTGLLYDPVTYIVYNPETLEVVTDPPEVDLTSGTAAGDSNPGGEAGSDASEGGETGDGTTSGGEAGSDMSSGGEAGQDQSGALGDQGSQTSIWDNANTDAIQIYSSDSNNNEQEQAVLVGQDQGAQEGQEQGTQEGQNQGLQEAQSQEEEMLSTQEVVLPETFKLSLSYASSDPAETGTLEAGTKVIVSANDRSNEGEAFDHWEPTGLQMSEEQLTQNPVEIEMPASDVSLTAKYKKNVFALTLSDATSDLAVTEALEAGTKVVVSAKDRSEEGYVFDHWEPTGLQMSEEQLTQNPVEIEMPANDASLAADYKQIRTLSLTNATSDAPQILTAGMTVNVKANDPGEKQEFTGWDAKGIDLGDNQKNPSIQITMPDGDVSLTAQYADIVPTETITVVNAKIEGVESVDNGDGSSSATVQDGTTVTVTANPAPEGTKFEKWDVTSQGDVKTSDITEPDLQLTASGADVKAEPVFTAQQVQDPNITVIQPQAGTGTINETPTKEYSGNDVKYTFTLNPGTGYIADNFSATIENNTNGQFVVNPTLSEDKTKGTFTVTKKDPAENINVTASFGLKSYTVTAVSGTADAATHKLGETVTVTANAPAAGQRFTKWSSADGVTFAQETASQTTFTMPAKNVSVTANYEPILYNLTVTNGTGSGQHASGEQVVITANTPQTGYRFRNWTITSGNGSFSLDTAAQTVFTMGASDAVVTANYELIPYTLTVKNGSGSGTFTMGTTTDITPNFPASGKEFDYWEKTSGKVQIDNAKSYYSSVTMKASDATVTARYKDGPNPNNNTITGLENGAEYLKSTTLSFTAGGAGMDNKNPNPGDYRYRPASYQIGSVGGSWSAPPYTTSMAINAVGDYTLTVNYAKDVYDGSDWVADGTSVSKSITFHVVNALSVKTGDNSPLIPLAIAGGIALAVIIILIIVLKKRRKG